MLLTKHGFNSNIDNVQHLEAIFDLIEGKWKIGKLNYHYYFIYDNYNDIFNEETKLHQNFLSKKFWTYRKYDMDVGGIKFCAICSESDFYKEVDEFNKKEEERIKKALIRQKQLKKKEEKKINADRGIYGIYYNKELIYIGKTDVNFETRFKQHKDALISGSEVQYLYKYLKEEKKKYGEVSISFKPLINVKDFKIENISDITNRDIEAMELALIHLYKPICNIQGVKQDYKFTY